MLLSLSLVIILGFAFYGLFFKLRLPGFLGMLIAGVVLGPDVLNLLSDELLGISASLRQIALVVILLHAGLCLDLSALRRVGRPALLLCFLPALLEMGAVTVLGYYFLAMPLLEAGLLGTVLAAVSPAVIVPRMIQLTQQRWGENHHVPQMIMAGSSVDDVFALVIFGILLAMWQGSEQISTLSLSLIPISLLSGAAIGVGLGFGLVFIFQRVHMRDTVKVLILLGLSFLLLASEDLLPRTLSFSGLLAVLFLGMTILKRYGKLARRISGKLSKIWVAASLLLFVLLGAAIPLSHEKEGSFLLIAVIAIGLAVRFVGVWLSLIKTPLLFKERLYCVFAYIPKATVQAAIGAIPLSVGVASGHIILTAAALSILICAPIGAVLMDKSYRRLLSRPPKNNPEVT